MSATTSTEQGNSSTEIVYVSGEKIKKIIKENGIHDAVSEVIVKNAGLEADGFASVTRFVTVNFENPEKKPLHLFVKVPTQNPSHVAMYEEMKAFEKEATFLVDYVAAAEQMCKEKGRKGFIDFYPKCYFGNEKMIVLENLVVARGYEKIDEVTRQNLEASKFSVITLAKHHAISHLLIEEVGGIQTFLELFPDLDLECYEQTIFKGVLGPPFDGTIRSHIRILEKSRLEGAEHTANTLRSFLGKPMDILLDVLRRQDDDLLVLGHGDYKNNNMMYLRDPNGKIVHHIAIDFQITRYNSAALDLCYLFFISLPWRVRQNYLTELLELYKNTFNDVTEDFGSPANLTFEKIFLEYRKKFPYGFWMSLGLSVGPGNAVYKEVDITKIDMKDFTEISERCSNQWIEDNPDKAEEVAEELINIFREYEDLSHKE